MHSLVDLPHASVSCARTAERHIARYSPLHRTECTPPPPPGWLHCLDWPLRSGLIRTNPVPRCRHGLPRANLVHPGPRLCCHDPIESRLSTSPTRLSPPTQLSSRAETPSYHLVAVSAYTPTDRSCSVRPIFFITTDQARAPKVSFNSSF